MPSFVGTVSLPDQPGQGLESKLLVENGELALSCRVGELGRWGLDQITATRSSEDEFRLVIAGELVRVSVDRPEEFSSLVGADIAPQQDKAGRALTPLGNQAARAAPQTRRAGRQPLGLTRVGRLSLVVVVAGVILMLAAAMVLKLFDGGGRSLSPVPAIGSGEGATVGMAELTLVEFQDRWNEAAQAVESSLTISSFSVQEGETEDAFQYAFSEALFLQGSVSRSGGNVERVMVLGTAEEDPESEAGAAWGVLLAAVEPGLSAQERTNLLEELGLSSEVLDLATLGGSAVRGNSIFEVQASPAAGAILLKVTDSRAVVDGTG